MSREYSEILIQSRVAGVESTELYPRHPQPLTLAGARGADARDAWLHQAQLSAERQSRISGFPEHFICGERGRGSLSTVIRDCDEVCHSQLNATTVIQTEYAAQKPNTEDCPL